MYVGLKESKSSFGKILDAVAVFELIRTFPNIPLVLRLVDTYETASYNL